MTAPTPATPSPEARRTPAGRWPYGQTVTNPPSSDAGRDAPRPGTAVPAAPGRPGVEDLVEAPRSRPPCAQARRRPGATWWSNSPGGPTTRSGRAALVLLGQLSSRPAHALSGLSEQQHIEHTRQIARTADPLTSAVLHVMAAHRGSGALATRPLWEQTPPNIRQAALQDRLITVCTWIGSDGGQLGPVQPCGSSARPSPTPAPGCDRACPAGLTKVRQAATIAPCLRAPCRG
ncbi:hypothetical protein GCM10009665_33370 [Kitasatospora nipponensis]|uniref:Uncharacterized protein n=1 Tax=Kitasatospora nipponensis TaxID=258049 RepID=A0ABN1W8F6_9ACTN